MLLKIILTLLVFSLFAIEGKPQGFGGGMRAGITASEVSGDNLSGPNKPGWYAAFYTSRELTPAQRLILEIMYTKKGSRSVPSERNNFYEYIFSLDYVEIPLLYQLDVAQVARIDNLRRLTIYTGLSLSRLVNHFESDDGTTTFLPGEKPPFRAAELNFLFGLGFSVSSRIDFQLGFSNGLTPLRPHTSGATRPFNRGQYNTVWSFGLSYSIW
jgi:hypothetical protein